MGSLKQFLFHNAFLFIIGVVLLAVASRTLRYQVYEASPMPSAKVTSRVVSPLDNAAKNTTANQSVLIGAGDIADCYNTNDEATAQLVEGINGTVFTLGDNIYPIGTEENFAKCYGPTRGRFLGRTKPAAGNH